MMGFDSATSSFLALLVNNSHRKLKKAKLKTQVFNFAVENYFFVSKVLQSNLSPRPQKFRWPVMAVKLRKGQKKLKIFVNNCKF